MFQNLGYQFRSNKFSVDVIYVKLCHDFQTLECKIYPLGGMQYTNHTSKGN